MEQSNTRLQAHGRARAWSPRRAALDSYQARPTSMNRSAQTMTLILTWLTVALTLSSVVAVGVFVSRPSLPMHASDSALPASESRGGSPETFTPASPAESPETVDALFRQQDRNGDGDLDLEEAMSFFEWVEENIQYRWDDENLVKETYGYPVGDGRPGPHYLQTPAETFAERMGDCEDQNVLEVAFYRYWDVPAYLAFVNVYTNGSYDHAIAIVYGAESLDGFRATFGDAPFYEAKDRPGILDGFYFIVDNSYSGVFGEISGGLPPGKFVIHHLASYDSLYGGAWAPGNAIEADVSAASAQRFR